MNKMIFANPIKKLSNKFFDFFKLQKFNFYQSKAFYLLNKRQFSTNNQISEKESLDLVEAGVFEILKSAAKCKHEKLNRSATFEELGFDSLDQVELVVAMEEKFGINVSDDDSLKIQSVLDAIQIMHSYYLKEKVNVGTVLEKKEDEKNVSSK
jgi:acyl carrier protein